MRSIPLLYLARLLTILLLIAFLGHGNAADAQSGGVAVRFHGQVKLVGAEVTSAERQTFAPVSRMLLQVVNPRTADDVTVCASAVITLDQPYEIEIPARPPCVSQTVADPAPQFLFLVNGVQAAAHGRVIVNPNLSAPQTLGASYERTLEVPFGAVVPNAPIATGGRLIRVRYWGTMMLANQPAPEGTEVRVVTAQGGRLCGTGMVENGLYVVDVPATPGECTHRGPNDDAIFLAFVVNGERVVAHGRDIASPAYIGPASLAHAYRRDLEGRNPPPADVFAANDCGGDGDVESGWLAVGRNTAAKTVMAAQEQPTSCIRLPSVLVIGDAGLRSKVTTCFQYYEEIKNRPGAEPLRDVVDSLYEQDPANPRITIVEDAWIWLVGYLGVTEPSDEAGVNDARLGIPSAAQVRVQPSLTAALLDADRLVLEGFFGEVSQWDYCGTLFHELAHALDYITGSQPPESLECVLPDGTRLKAQEIKASAVENAYRFSRRLPLRTHYDDRPLPQAAVYPTPATWMRYQSDPAEICR